jgi:hypothetical protein
VQVVAVAGQYGVMVASVPISGTEVATFGALVIDGCEVLLPLQALVTLGPESKKLFCRLGPSLLCLVHDGYKGVSGVRPILKTDPPYGGLQNDIQHLGYTGYIL